MSEMAKITIELNEEEFKALSAMAKDRRRNWRDQAAWLVARAVYHWGYSDGNDRGPTYAADEEEGDPFPLVHLGNPEAIAAHAERVADAVTNELSRSMRIK